MDIGWAIDRLLEGHKIKRSQWAPYYWLQYSEKPPKGYAVGGIYQYGHRPEYKATFTQEEVLATNWEISPCGHP